MIISQLLGGLGNQLFQYAAGRALAISQHSTLKLDVSSFNRGTHHQGFQLPDIFRGSFQTVTQAEVDVVLGWRSSSHLRYFFSQPIRRLLSGPNYVAEPHFQYWPGIWQVGPNAYLSGYWQSARYFADCASQIRDELAFKLKLTGRNAMLADQIRQCNAVSVHVRRGDYVNNTRAAAHHGACSVAYYRDAVQRMVRDAGPAEFYIFSDDPQWVLENIQVDVPCVYVDHNRGSVSYCDMQLMSLCKHHIIANSSFSWWGAWLNPSTSKIVIAPQNWFAKPIPTQDLLPSQWIQL